MAGRGEERIGFGRAVAACRIEMHLPPPLATASRIGCTPCHPASMLSARLNSVGSPISTS